MRIQQLPATPANSFGGSPQKSSNIAPTLDSSSLSVHQSAGDMQLIILLIPNILLSFFMNPDAN